MKCQSSRSSSRTDGVDGTGTTAESVGGTCTSGKVEEPTAERVPLKLRFPVKSEFPETA